MRYFWVDVLWSYLCPAGNPASILSIKIGFLVALSLWIWRLPHQKLVCFSSPVHLSPPIDTLDMNPARARSLPSPGCSGGTHVMRFSVSVFICFSRTCGGQMERLPFLFYVMKSLRDPKWRVRYPTIAMIFWDINFTLNANVDIFLINFFFLLFSLHMMLAESWGRCPTLWVSTN